MEVAERTRAEMALEVDALIEHATAELQGQLETLTGELHRAAAIVDVVDF